MTVEAILQEVEQREKEVTAVRKLWSVTVGKHVPSVVQVSTWLALHSFDAVIEGVRIAGKKIYLKLLRIWLGCAVNRDVRQSLNSRENALLDSDQTLRLGNCASRPDHRLLEAQHALIHAENRAQGMSNALQ